MRTCFSLFFCLIGLAGVAPAAGQDVGEGLSGLSRAFGRVTFSGAAEAVRSETLETLQKLHPARLARRGRAPGMNLHEGWQTAPLDRPLVIAIHGFYSNRDRTESLLSGAQAAGFPVGCFEYASEQTIDEAARLLAESLRKISAEQPEREVVLITHSLGGVVSRRMLESPDLDPGNVKRLMMIAPPNHGTALVNLAFSIKPAVGAEEREGEAAVEAGRAALAKFIIGPVGEDMQPGCEFLTSLNARPRNPNVRYTIFLGTKAPLAANGATILEAASDATNRRWHWTRWVGQEVSQRLAHLAEVHTGSGDGVVSVESGRLEGVDDVVLLPFHHNEPLWDEDEPAVQQLQCEILHRLLPE